MRLWSSNPSLHIFASSTTISISNLKSPLSFSLGVENQDEVFVFGINAWRVWEPGEAYCFNFQADYGAIFEAIKELQLFAQEFLV